MSRSMQPVIKIHKSIRVTHYVHSLFFHGTLKKYANFVYAEAERFLRRSNLKSLPYLLQMDPCNYCNLKCTLCPTGQKVLKRPQMILSLENFKRYFDPLASYLFEVSFYNWGEPLVNKDIFSMIDYAHQCNVGTNMSSNMMFSDISIIDRLLDSQLEYLIVSIDGTTAESYQKYRVQGNFEQVLNNTRMLLQRRKERRQKKPVVEWQFVVSRANEHQIGDAEALAKTLGVDLIRFRPFVLPFESTNRRELAEQWFPIGSKNGDRRRPDELIFGHVRKKGPCPILYRTMVVNPDGGISPCYYVYQQDRDFAKFDGSTPDIRAIWNNEMFCSGRLSSANLKAEGKPLVACDICDLYYHS